MKQKGKGVKGKGMKLCNLKALNALVEIKEPLGKVNYKKTEGGLSWQFSG